MGLFRRKKEKQEVPELPQLPRLPPIPFQDTTKIQGIPINSEEDYRKSTLPSFPTSNFGNKINQSTIKEAVEESENNENSESRYNEPEFSHMVPSIIPKIPMPMRPQINKVRSLEMSDWNNRNTETRVKRTEPIFVKLEKFENALSTFNEIKLRIGEIDSLLNDIREVKRKEEAELEEWQREIETIKARLDQIDKEVFNNL
ncbi:MAG: hypothetical protein AABW91_02735 [Nanoarchaeota archaeon]